MKMKKFMASVLAISTLGSFVACMPETEVEIDKNKTQLYVGVYDGGVGYHWLDDLIAGFEESVKDVSFESGKSGVQIIVDLDKSGFQGDGFIANIPFNRQDLYFVSDNSYKALVEANVLGDLTNIVTKKNYDENGEWVGFNKGTTALVDRLDSHFAASLNTGTTENPQYYALPYYAALQGIWYDVELFEENGYLTWGNGPDGKVGTYDDGLPATWNDFMDLLDIMVLDGITPFTWCGMYEGYRTDPLKTVWAAYEGVNNFSLNYSFNGTDSRLGAINDSNAYLLQQQQGKMAALKAAYDITSNAAYYSADAFRSSQTHLLTQESYLYSAHSGKRIAMLLEGGWWENEAKPVMEEMSKIKEDYGEMVREFSYLTIPRFVGVEDVQDQETTDRNTVYVAGSKSHVLANKASKKLELVEEFIGYVHSNSALRHFTKETGMPRAFTYELTTEDMAVMTPTAKNVWEIWTADNTDKAFNEVTSDMRYFLGSYVNSWDWGSTINGLGMLKDPIKNFRDYANDPNYMLNPTKYFSGIQKQFSASEWEIQYNLYKGQ